MKEKAQKLGGWRASYKLFLISSMTQAIFLFTGIFACSNFSRGFVIGRVASMPSFVALTVIIGGLVGYFLSSYIGEFIPLILPFAAGGFIYIAASDLIPELHKEVNPRRSLASFAVFFLGFAFMLFVKLYFPP